MTQEKQELLDLLSLTEIMMDTLATRLPPVGDYSPPKPVTLDFKANFISAASIASELILKRNVDMSEVEHLVPTAKASEGRCLADLSTSIWDGRGRTAKAVDDACSKYGIVDYKCHNTSLFGKDRRVINVRHPIVSELGKRREEYMRKAQTGAISFASTSRGGKSIKQD